jgi:hypothetical protein
MVGYAAVSPMGVTGMLPGRRVVDGMGMCGWSLRPPGVSMATTT